MALAFVNSRPFLTSNIIGATDMTQLRSNIESQNVNLPKDVLREIENIHNRQANPCP
jgi:aryl-alcohol dehydrogenase-like predicted oxidoreductase